MNEAPDGIDEMRRRLESEGTFQGYWNPLAVRAKVKDASKASALTGEERGQQHSARSPGKPVPRKSIAMLTDLSDRRFDLITKDPNRMEEISLFLALIILMSATMFKATHDARRAGWPMPDAAHKLVDGGSAIVLVGASLFMIRLAATPVVVTCRQRRVKNELRSRTDFRSVDSDVGALGRVRSFLAQSTPSQITQNASQEPERKIF